MILMAKYNQETSQPHKLPLLSSQEMRKVLEDLQDDQNLIEPDDQQELNEVLEDISSDSRLQTPDIPEFEEDLGLGWSGERVREARQQPEDRPADSRLPSNPSPEQTLVETARVVASGGSSSCEGRLEAGGSSEAEAVPIHRGDLIEFLVGERTWFLVEVTGRGKVGGRNQNYLNVRYSDGSEGGVFIDRHRWRVVQRREEVVVREEEEGEAGRPCSVRLHRVTLHPDTSLHRTAHPGYDTDTTEEEEDCTAAVSESEQPSAAAPRPASHRSPRKRRRRTRKRPREESRPGGWSGPAAEIRRGDRLEYLGGDTVFRVEVLSRGKSSGRNKNYINIRYEDGSEGGVFIEQHQWRFIGRGEVGSEEETEPRESRGKERKKAEESREHKKEEWRIVSLKIEEGEEEIAVETV